MRLVSTAVSTWHKAGVFNDIPKSVQSIENSGSLNYVFVVARLAMSVCDERGLYASPTHRLGSAPVEALLNGGVQLLLNRPDAEAGRFGAAGMVGMLNLDFASLAISSHKPDGSTVGERQRLSGDGVSAMGSIVAGLSSGSAAGRAALWTGRRVRESTNCGLRMAPKPVVHLTFLSS